MEAQTWNPVVCRTQNDKGLLQSELQNFNRESCQDNTEVKDVQCLNSF